MAVTDPAGARAGAPAGAPARRAPAREVLTAPQAELLQRLFSPVERWGWEYRDPAGVPQPFPRPRPVPDLPWPRWAAELTPELERAERARVGLLIAAGTALLVGLLAAPSSPAVRIGLLAVAGVLGGLGLAWP